MSTSPLWQKVIASLVNCGLVLLVTLPLLPLIGVELWKLTAVATFFSYNMFFRKRCLGMRLVHTFIEPPTTFFYALNYTIAFASYLYSVIIPGDLAALNGLAQMVTYMTTGNTWQAQLAGQGTMSQQQYIERAQERARLLAYEGRLGQAVGSMACDMHKYEELRVDPSINAVGIEAAARGDREAVLLWIEGFANE